MKIILSVFVLFVFSLQLISAQVSDIDGNKYKTVKIGALEWMSENLSTSKFKNGDPIPFAKNAQEWQSLTSKGSPAWCYPDFKEENGKIFGKLYNFYAVSDLRGLAPDGWEPASADAWKQIVKNFDAAAKTDCVDCIMSENAGKALKSNTAGHWEDSAEKALANSGLNLQGGGHTNISGEPFGLTTTGFFWTGTQDGEQIACAIMLIGLNHRVRLILKDKKFGYSVRCMKSAGQKPKDSNPVVSNVQTSMNANQTVIGADVKVHDVLWDEVSKRYVFAGANIVKDNDFAWITSTAKPFIAFLDNQLKMTDTFMLPLQTMEEYCYFSKLAVFEKGYAAFGDEVFYTFDRNGKKLWQLDGRAKNMTFQQVEPAGNAQIVLYTTDYKKLSFDKRDIFAPETKSLGNYGAENKGDGVIISLPDKNSKTNLMRYITKTVDDESMGFWEIYEINFSETVTLEKKHTIPTQIKVKGSEVNLYYSKESVVVTRNGNGQITIIGTDEYNEYAENETEPEKHYYRVWMHVIDGSESGKTSIIAQGRKIISNSRMRIKNLNNGQFLIAETNSRIDQKSLKKFQEAAYLIVNTDGTIITKGTLNLSKVTHPETANFRNLDYISLNWTVKPNNKIEAFVGFRGYSEDRDTVKGGYKKASDGVSNSSTFYGKHLITRVQVN